MMARARGMRAVSGLRTAVLLVALGVALAGGQRVGAQDTTPAPAPPPTTTAAQDGFVPIDELPAEDRLPAAPFLVGAYTVALVLLAGYVWLLWRRLGTVQRELNEARRAARPGGAPM